MSTPTTPTPSTGLKLAVKPQGDMTVVACSGRLIASVSQQFRAEIGEVIRRSNHVVLDFSALSQVDSSGLGSLVSLYVTAQRSGRRLELINLNRHVRELLGLTNLLSIFESCGQYFTKMP